MKVKEKFKNSQVEDYINNREACRCWNIKNKNGIKKITVTSSTFKENKLKKQNQIQK